MSEPLKTLTLLRNHGGRKKGAVIEVDALRGDRMLADQIAQEPRAAAAPTRKPTDAKEGENNG